MSEVNNKDPMERIIHQAFHDLADKHGIDVDKIAEIIGDYDDMMSKALEKRLVFSEN